MGEGIQVEDQKVRKSFGLALVGALAIAGVVALVAIWLPARHASEERSWQSAGQRALAKVVFPPSIQPYDGIGQRIQVCGNGPYWRCYVTSGDPATNVATVKSALTPNASGPVRGSCQPTPVANSPATCTILIPVPGSRLAVNLFARARTNGPHGPTLTYAGTYVLVHVDNR
jgi:hypothetical protein